MERLEGRTLLSSYTAANVSDLIAQINSANLTPEADAITLAAGNTFSLTAVDNTANGPTGLPVIAAGGGTLTILGNGNTIERSSNTGTPSFRLFKVATGASLTLQNLTLQGGSAYSSGGAVFNEGTLSLQSVIIQNNTAQGGGGGFYGGPGFAGIGGAVYSSGVLSLQGCIIQNNRAIGGRGADGNYVFDATDGGNGLGGGLFIGAGSSAVIKNSTITANTAQGGEGGDGYRASGGLHSRSGSKGTSAGGGIYISTFPLYPVSASVGLDTYTVKRVTQNIATKSKDIFGSYVVIP